MSKIQTKTVKTGSTQSKGTRIARKQSTATAKANSTATKAFRAPAASPFHIESLVVPPGIGSVTFSNSPANKSRTLRRQALREVQVYIPNEEHSEPKRRHKSSAFASIHEAMSDLHDAGMLDQQTMREIDEDSLVASEPMTPERIRKLRQRENMSQPVFAIYLNVSRNLISDWERGAKKPGGPACRLLEVVERNGIEILATH